MSIDLTTINPHQILWIAGLIVAIFLVFVVVRFFFRHLLHFLFHGCGWILLIAVVLYVLHALKAF